MLIFETQETPSDKMRLELRLAYYWELYKHNKPKLMKLRGVFARSPTYAFRFAKEIIRGPFPEGEEAIAQDATEAVVYARDILKGRFPKGEEIIASSGSHALMYARDVLKKPWKKGEPAIMSNIQLRWSYETEFGIKIPKDAK